LSALLVPTAEEIKAAPRFAISSEKPGYFTWGETVASGVLGKTMSALTARFGEELFQSNGQTQLRTRGFKLGIATDSSYNDIHIERGGLPLLDMENKGGETSLFPAIQQVAVTCTNFAMGLMNKGVPRARCIVPGVANNGVSMLFGATIVLEESFPTFVPLSKQLDLLDPHESRVACAYLQKASSFCLSLDSIAGGVKGGVKEMRLCLSKYHVKTLDANAIGKGLGLFYPQEYSQPSDLQPGIDHMIDCLNLIYASVDARAVAEYPLSIRTPDEINAANGSQFFELIYRNLSTLGYNTGAPDRVADEDLYQRYLTSLQTAVAAVHAAGVLHCDLYASNVMYKVVAETGAVEVKFVDWDCAHCLDEGSFCELPKKQLVSFYRRVRMKQELVFGVNHDLLYLSVYEMSFDSAHLDLWKNLASNDKSKIDASFEELFIVRNGG
jgi:hypothetical protein